MAVNDNDRVTSRRLKQFWDIAKTWIQSLVSGAIDTSEAAMETSMDTKILAAKPNYRMPNENNQIGVGYGDNIPELYFYTFSASVNKLSLSDFATNNILDAPLSAAYKQNITAINTFPTISTTYYRDLFIKSMSGKLGILPAPMNGVIENIDDIDDAWFNSTYDGEVWLSPIISYEDHTYQTRLRKVPTSNNSFYYDYKIDDGDFTTPTQITNITILICLDVHNPLCSFAKIPNTLSITGSQLKNNIISDVKIADHAVTLAKVAYDLRTRTHTIKTKMITDNDLGNVYSKIMVKSTFNSYDDTELVGLNIFGTWDKFADLATISNEEYMFNTSDISSLSRLSIGIRATFPDFGTNNGFAWLKTDNGTYFDAITCYNPTVSGGSNVMDASKFAIKFLGTNILNHTAENNAMLYVFIGLNS